MRDGALDFGEPDPDSDPAFACPGTAIMALPDEELAAFQAARDRDSAAREENPWWKDFYLRRAELHERKD